LSPPRPDPSLVLISAFIFVLHFFLNLFQSCLAGRDCEVLSIDTATDDLCGVRIFWLLLPKTHTVISRQPVGRSSRRSLSLSNASLLSAWDLRQACGGTAVCHFKGSRIGYPPKAGKPDQFAPAWCSLAVHVCASCAYDTHTHTQQTFVSWSVFEAIAVAVKS
jgi:hypothetical protein